MLTIAVVKSLTKTLVVNSDKRQASSPSSSSICKRQAPSAKRTTYSCIVFSYIPCANPNHLPSVSYNPIDVKKFIYTYTHWHCSWDNVRCIINKQKEENMTPKDVNKTIERLDSQDWKNMKEHLDKKFPSMTLPTVEDFKELVKLYGKFKEYKEGRLN